MNNDTVKSISIRSAFFSITSFLFLISVIALNYFSDFFSSKIPFLQKDFIAIFTLISSIFFVTYLYRRENNFQTLKYEFVNIVTHKFRTPLTYVTWSIENLKKNQTPEEKNESIRQLEAASTRLTEMTDILIDMAHIQEGYAYVFKAESFREIVEKSMRDFSPELRAKEIKFNIQMSQDLPLISVDTKRMAMVVKTLFENAIVYTPKGGLIEIIVSLVGNRAIRFSIKDSGIGFSRGEKKHVFSMFYRTRKSTAVDTEGMGLGLFIAKHIVERHGGRIWAESEGNGKGATFIFEIPLRHGR